MKHAIRTTFYGFGVICIMIGFCVLVGAGGNADLGGSMATEVVPYIMKGAAIMFGGLFLCWWNEHR